MRKILVTGANGQLGNELRVVSKFHSEADFVFVDVAELDITNAKAVQDFLQKIILLIVLIVLHTLPLIKRKVILL